MSIKKALGFDGGETIASMKKRFTFLNQEDEPLV
ncbi:hypothetical protein BSG1_12996 [Bacillus sp. SG-1]|nr:hypothetical protein BSG1_12996 [Bacillus sp. SG-1]